MTLVFVTKECARLAAKAGITSEDLLEAANRAESGKVDAQLGVCLIKQRVARPGQGRSGGARAILFFQKDNRAVFLHVFTKNQKSTLSVHESATYRDAAKVLASLSNTDFARTVAKQKWIKLE